MKIEISATPRQVQGTGASRRLRRTGRVPGILYGADQAAMPIEIDHNELFHKIKLEAFHSSILAMNLDGQKHQVLLRDAHWHPFRTQVLHVDFQRVAADKKIHIKIPLHFVNADIAPGVKLAGGLVSHIMNEVDVTCLPADLPEFIDVDLANLAAGHSLHLADLTAPAGVQFTQLTRGDNAVVATIVIPKVITEEEEAAAAAATPAAGEVPTVAQAAPKEGEAVPEEKEKGKESKEKEKKK